MTSIGSPVPATIYTVGLVLEDGPKGVSVKDIQSRSALDSAGVRYGDLLVGIGQDVCPDQASSASKVWMYACVHVCMCV